MFSQFCFSQQQEALKLYNEAIEFYNKQEYHTADSIFTASLEMLPSGDSYFARALCRGKMADKKGYCINLAFASNHGTDKATGLFLKSCGRIDTADNWTTQNSGLLDLSRKVTYIISDSLKIPFLHKSTPQQRDTIHRAGEEQAEFPGGTAAMMKYIQKNRQIPNTQWGGSVYIKFTIHEDGTIHDVNITKGGSPECPECEEEAIRLVTNMPAWKPARMNGRAVKCYFTLSVSFRH